MPILLILLSIGVAARLDAGPLTWCVKWLRAMIPGQYTKEIVPLRGQPLKGPSSLEFDVYWLTVPHRHANELYLIVPKNGDAPYVKKKYSPDDIDGEDLSASELRQLSLENLNDDYFRMNELLQIKSHHPEIMDVASVSKDPSDETALKLPYVEGRDLFSLLRDPKFHPWSQRQLRAQFRKKMEALKRVFEDSGKYEVNEFREESYEGNFGVSAYAWTVTRKRDGALINFYIKPSDVIVSRGDDGKYHMTLVDGF